MVEDEEPPLLRLFGRIEETVAVGDGTKAIGMSYFPDKKLVYWRSATRYCDEVIMVGWWDLKRVTWEDIERDLEDEDLWRCRKCESKKK